MISTTSVIGTIALGAGAYYAGTSGLAYAKRKVGETANRVQEFMHGYQLRTDAAIASCVIAAIGGHVMPGLSSPYMSLFVGGATVLAICGFNLKVGSMRPLLPGPGQPLNIDPSSPLHLNADTCEFMDNRGPEGTGIRVDSVAAAARVMSLTDRSAYDFRGFVERHTAQEIHLWLTANQGRAGLYIKDSFNWAANVKVLLNHKYGIGVAADALSGHQIENRRCLIESMGPDKDNPNPLRHPPVEGIPLTERQLSGLLTDIRSQVYAESKQRH